MGVTLHAYAVANCGEYQSLDSTEARKFNPYEIYSEDIDLTAPESRYDDWVHTACPFVDPCPYCGRRAKDILERSSLPLTMPAAETVLHELKLLSVSTWRRIQI